MVRLWDESQGARGYYPDVVPYRASCSGMAIALLGAAEWARREAHPLTLGWSAWAREAREQARMVISGEY